MKKLTKRLLIIPALIVGLITMTLGVVSQKMDSIFLAIPSPEVALLCLLGGLCLSLLAIGVQILVEPKEPVRPLQKEEASSKKLKDPLPSIRPPFLSQDMAKTQTPHVEARTPCLHFIKEDYYRSIEIFASSSQIRTLTSTELSSKVTKMKFLKEKTGGIKGLAYFLIHFIESMPENEIHASTLKGLMGLMILISGEKLETFAQFKEWVGTLVVEKGKVHLLEQALARVVDQSIPRRPINTQTQQYYLYPDLQRLSFLAEYLGFSLRLSYVDLDQVDLDQGETKVHAFFEYPILLPSSRKDIKDLFKSISKGEPPYYPGDKVDPYTLVIACQAKQVCVSTRHFQKPKLSTAPKPV